MPQGEQTLLLTPAILMKLKGTKHSAITLLLSITRLVSSNIPARQIGCI